MKHVLNIAVDLEELLVERTRDHIFNEVRISELFPQFAEVRISGIHPFAVLMDSQINGTQMVDTNLFPSITIIDDSDLKDPDAGMPTLEENAKVEESEVEHIESDEDKQMYIVSDQTLKALKDLTVNDGIVYGTGGAQRRRSSMVAEIWSRNMKVKNRLYDIMRNFLVMSGRFFLNSDYDVVIREETIAGQKSGNYNFDFGYIIYGGIIRFDIVQVMHQYIIDTDILAVDTILHQETEVGNGED